MTLPTSSASFWRKISFATRVWVTAARVQWEMRRRPLPEIVRRLGKVEETSVLPWGPIHMGEIIARLLTVGPWTARCITLSLVHYHFLAERGLRPSLVIGLPDEPTSQDAHAWVEVGGRDMGPPPGRGRNEPMAKYDAP